MPAPVAATPPARLQLDFAERNGTLTVHGALTLAELAAARRQFDKIFSSVRKGRERTIQIDLSGLDTMDTAGAWQLHRWQAALADKGLTVHVRGVPDDQAALLKLVETLPHEDLPVQVRTSSLMAGLIRVGRGTDNLRTGFMLLLTLLGQLCVGFVQIAVGRRAFRWNAFIRHIRETGVQAIPIVMMLAFLMSIVLAYQGIAQLKTFGAQQFTVNFIAIGFLREMGGIIAAMMVAGRSGSAFTSEIGVMRIREEVDALKIMGLDPLDVLIIPRIAALMVVLPLLTFLAFVAGLLGGALVSLLALGMSFGAYLERFAGAVTVETAMIGLIKAPVFAVFIGLIGCLAGLQVQGSAESVGKQTTKAVVQGITAILLLDAMFSVLFVLIGW